MREDCKIRSYSSMSAPTGNASTPVKDAKKKGAKPKPSFNHSQQRKMPIEYLGEETPGPGSYLPASTFGRYAKSTQQSNKKPSSSFRSGSAQRTQASNQQVPGAGAYTPNKYATEKNRNNPSSTMKSKSKRFGSGVGIPDGASDGDRKHEPGPGEYDSHNYKTIQTYLHNKKERMSRHAARESTAQHGTTA